MPKPDADKLFKVDQVVAVDGRAALITQIGGDGSTHDTSSIHYSFINPDGTLGIGGYTYPWAKDIKHIDFAKVWTMVKLPPEWETRAIEYDKKQQSEKKKSPIDDWDPETHPSYGSVFVGRCSGHMSLFMSPFKHQNFMSLSIRRATKHRSLANDRIYPEREVIEIFMSEAQWARLVSSAGIGEGTPCTISHVGGEMMPECPKQADIEKFHDDTKRYMEKSADCLNDSIKMVEALMEKPSVTKAERKVLLDTLKSARSSLGGGLPFIATQLRERMESIVSDGKTEIEAFFQRQVQRLGLKQLSESPIEMEVKELPKAHSDTSEGGDLAEASLNNK